jgi:hypothetical protein
MGLADVTGDGVRWAVAEFDRLGQQAFLGRYGFGSAREYFLVIAEMDYDSKAIVGAAHGYDRPDLGPLGNEEFSGGQATVQRCLEDLGFTVERREKVAAQRNPPWAREELILALELYLSDGQLDDGDDAVITLSTELNSLQVHTDRPDRTRFRNPNGVAMKLANFAAIDPSYPGKGLSRFGKADQATWDEFRGDADAVASAAFGVRGGYGPTLPADAGGVIVRDRPVEQHLTDQFKVSATKGGSGHRREQELVRRFLGWLEDQGHEVTSRSYAIPGGRTLASDLVDVTSGVLYEAKSSVRRESLRMAVGQLLDYRRFEADGVKLIVLLPRTPSADGLDYLRSVGVGAVWPAGDGFVQSD